MQIDRSNCILSITGKPIPNVGGGWVSSKYNINQFIKKSKNLGIIFVNQRSGHKKAQLIQHNITDALTVSLHNPTCHAAKDIVRYVTKYNIIKIAYTFTNFTFIENKNFKYHQDLLFEDNNDINFDKIKNTTFVIDRNYVINYVKQKFINTEKIEFENLFKQIIKGVNK